MDWNLGSCWESPILAGNPRWIVTAVQAQIGPYLIASKILILEEYSYLMVMWWIIFRFGKIARLILILPENILPIQWRSEDCSRLSKKKKQQTTRDRINIHTCAWLLPTRWIKRRSDGPLVQTIWIFTYSMVGMRTAANYQSKINNGRQKRQQK